jgi:DHA1 family solute carrier family 18 vesicular amine transporter 1/2
MTALFLTAAVWRLRLKETVTSKEPIRFRYFISSYPKAIKESFGVWKSLSRSAFWLFIVQTTVMFGISLTQVINALYARDVLLISEEQWWLVFIPLLLTIIAVSLPIGKMVDKIGRKIPLILGLFTFSLATVLFITGDFLTIMISMSLFATGQLLVMSAAMALSTDLVPSVHRGKVVGFRNFVGYIAMGLGMLLGSYLYVTFIPQLPFYVSLGSIGAAGLIFLLLVHEPAKREGELE